MSRATADCRVAAGAWQRVGPGLYLPNSDQPAPEALAAVGRAYAGAEGVVSGLVAARALELRWVPEPRRVTVLVSAERQLQSQPLVRVRRTASLADLATWRLGGVTYADAGRLVLDGGMGLRSLRDVRGVVLGAVAYRWTTVSEQQQILATEPRNGTRLLRRALRDADRGCASPPEAVLVFPGLGCGSEMDSRERHEDESNFERTLSRHDRFGGYGLVLSHLTPRRLRSDPAAAVMAVLDTARARLRLPAALREPAGLRLVPRGPLLR
jgi:hypothetical protein